MSVTEKDRDILARTLWGEVNGQEPYTWLRHVLERLPHAQSVADYEVLLPWSCSPEMPR